MVVRGCGRDLFFTLRKRVRRGRYKGGEWHKTPTVKRALQHPAPHRIPVRVRRAPSHRSLECDLLVPPPTSHPLTWSMRWKPGAFVKGAAQNSLPGMQGPLRHCEAWTETEPSIRATTAVRIMGGEMKSKPANNGIGLHELMQSVVPSAYTLLTHSGEK